MVERLAEFAGARRGLRVLDLATGTGAVARAAARRGASVVGVDIAGQMLAIARERSPEIDFRVADVHALPFEAGQFDAVTCGLSVSHFAEREQAFREVLRVLREGGRFVASAWGEGGATPSSRVAGEILARHAAVEPGSGLDEETWMHPDSGCGVLRGAGFDGVSVHTETFSGRFASGDDALAWTLAWPVRAARLARLDARSRDAILAEIRAAVASSDRSWRFVFNFYLAQRP